MVSCFLCRVIDGSPDVPFRALLPLEEAESEILFEFDSFVVVADTAPLTEGHCLIVSREHHRSMAVMGAAALDELISAIGVVEDHLCQLYGPISMFEHGTGTAAPRVNGACIEHAHLHLIPFDGNLVPSSRYSQSFFPISGLKDLASVAPSLSYLFSRSAADTSSMSLAQHVERQHWRIVVALAMGVPFQDWRLMSSDTAGRALARDRVQGLRRNLGF